MTISEAQSYDGYWSGFEVADDMRLAEIANQQLEPRSQISERSGIREFFAERKRVALAVGALTIVAAAGAATGRRAFSS